MNELNSDVSRKSFAFIYGVLLGDGCLCKCGKAKFISIVGHKKDDLDFFKILCNNLNILRNKKTKYRLRRKQRKIEINFSDKDLFFRLKESGFKVGKKGTEIRLPKKINKKFWEYIIQGYFATDGSLVICNNNGTRYPRIEFQSISKKLLIDVRDQLKHYGINGNIYVSRTYQNAKHHTLYRLQCNGRKNLEIFKRKLNFINPKHIEKYKKYVGEEI